MARGLQGAFRLGRSSAAQSGRTRSPGCLHLYLPQPFSSPCLKGARESPGATTSFSDLEILCHRPQTCPSAFRTGAVMPSAPQPHQSAWGTAPFSVLSATDKTRLQENKQPETLSIHSQCPVTGHCMGFSGTGLRSSVVALGPW